MKDSVSSLETERAAINQQIQELNVNYPNLSHLKQASAAIEKSVEQERVDLRTIEQKNEESEAEIKRLLQE